MVTGIGDERSMQVTFYGVRGSTPCHGEDTHKYGGNTSCVAVRIPGEQPIMFDLGTGARYFGATPTSCRSGLTSRFSRYW